MQPKDLQDYNEYEGEKGVQYKYELLRCYDSRLRTTDRMPNIYWMIDLASGLPLVWDREKLSNGKMDYKKHDVNLMLIQYDQERFPLNFGRDETNSDRTLFEEGEESHDGSIEEEGRKPAAKETADSSVMPEKPPSAPQPQDQDEEEESNEVSMEEDSRKQAAKETEKPPSSPQDYLWERNGDFLVIRVPFWMGTHDASNPSDFTPVVDFLKNLHAQGLVHGDIRCFNIVFNKGEGKLIDFDFGGSNGRHRYPRGYVADLVDGRRFGSRLKCIKLYDEWYALSFCMFFCHMFRTKDSGANTQIRDYQDELAILTDEGLAEYVNQIGEFLSQTQSLEWQCTLEPSFRREIGELAAGRGNPATGSPPDIKRA
jgi:hypothetical protein